MYAIRRQGYQSDVTNIDTGIVDYVPSTEGYDAENITISLGRVDYLIGITPYYSSSDITQGSGFSGTNWELIETLWENINEYWNT